MALLLLLASTASAAPDWPDHPGDFDRAAEQLAQALVAGYSSDLMASFGDARQYNRVGVDTETSARRILALYRMGKLSVHSDAVKRAFVLLFMKARANPTRHCEMIELYERIAVPNSDDPFWRIIRARCARALQLPETLQLYEQVAKDMTGVPPDDEVRGLWEANRKEFDLDDFTEERWRKRATSVFEGEAEVNDRGAPPTDGSPLPLLDLEQALGTVVAEWNDVLGASPQDHARELDGMLATVAKGVEVPWLNGLGVMSAHRALTMYLLARPPAELAGLRAVQEAGYRKATAGAAGSTSALDLFRRYPWSESAQRKLMETAGQHLFAGETQAAFRCFEDVLRHAEPGGLRDEAQVGLWISLAQFAEPDVLARAFDDVDTEATWPWNGRREKTGTIKQKLVGEAVTGPPAPSLSSLTPKIVRLPPLQIGGQRVFSVDMQCDGNRLLVSHPAMLAMYDADRPTAPLWVQRIPSGGVPRFAGQRIVTPSGLAHRLLSLGRDDGTIGHEGNPNGPQAIYRYSTIGGPVIADNRAYAVQFAQPYRSIYGHPEYLGWGSVALSCFGSNLEHLWTRRYESVEQTPASRFIRYGNAARLQVTQGAAFFSVMNAGCVIRLDCRDGEMEWVHLFSPAGGSQSLLCFGGEPVVTGNTVVYLPKFSGSLVAVDSNTGQRRWTLAFPWAYEMLGRHGDLVVLTGANIVFAVDVQSGKMRWGRQISPEWSEGFQLPHAQLIGDSVYCGTKKELFRFDARNGARLESRPWKMGTEVPMSFYVAGKDLYVVSDLPLRDPTLERQLVGYNTVIAPGGLPGKLPDGSEAIWRDGLLLMRVKDKKLLWGRFVTTAPAHGARMDARKDRIATITASGNSAGYDTDTGQLLYVDRIKIGGK